ncbi:helix-turn-helix family protein [Paraburkholderia xenovorans LB400]|jgi:transcriptional regulator with XRE-family HTH domain|nr:helix-turn-helix transcriptional regulator [Paraburkholderia xenovorans]AIP29891.1 helix-turn-helix family protein [Paraburkholderia xenovorans LB400]
MLYGQRYERVRKVLKSVRVSANLTQIELAQKLSKGQSYVSKLERGEQFVELLEFIEWCEACGIAPQTVIGEI